MLIGLIVVDVVVVVVEVVVRGGGAPGVVADEMERPLLAGSVPVVLDGGGGSRMDW